jgi:hypothetical protein
MYRKTVITAASALLAFAGTAILGTQTAAAQTVTVDDPIGDAPKNANAQTLKALDYFDIVQVSVSKESGPFTFTMRLAAPVPVTPPDPNGNPGTLMWIFPLDTQPGEIAGDPFPPGRDRRFEHFVVLKWDGAEFHGYVLDRTPLTSGGTTVSTPVPFSFNPARDEIAWVVDPALIGNPAAFQWFAVTDFHNSHDGSEAYHSPDITTLVGWPTP